MILSDRDLGSTMTGGSTVGTTTSIGGSTVGTTGTVQGTASSVGPTTGTSTYGSTTTGGYTPGQQATTNSYGTQNSYQGNPYASQQQSAASSYGTQGGYGRSLPQGGASTYPYSHGGARASYYSAGAQMNVVIGGTLVLLSTILCLYVDAL